MKACPVCLHYAARLNSGVRGHVMFRFVLAVLVIWPITAAAQDCAPNSLQRELLQRAEAAQTARNALSASPQSEETLNQTLHIDAENTAYMRTVIAKCGWPKKSAVGEKAAKAAWLDTQNADMDPQYQVIAAQQLKYAVLSKEAAPWDLAVLVDRNRRLADQSQVYGMQFFTTPEHIIHFYDIVTPSKLDARRKEIGLAPFYCWALEISKTNGNASIDWPSSVLFTPQSCPDAP